MPHISAATKKHLNMICWSSNRNTEKPNPMPRKTKQHGSKTKTEEKNSETQFGSSKEQWPSIGKRARKALHTDQNWASGTRTQTTLHCRCCIRREPRSRKASTRRTQRMLRIDSRFSQLGLGERRELWLQGSLQLGSVLARACVPSVGVLCFGYSSLFSFFFLYFFIFFFRFNTWGGPVGNWQFHGFLLGDQR